MLGIILQITQGAAVVQDTVAKAIQTVQETTQAPTQASLSLWELILKGGVIMLPIFL